jgi:hypothetical protein
MTMEEKTLQISTGLVRLPVSVDGVNGRVIEFNPNDVQFTERVLAFYHTVKSKTKEWEALDPELKQRIEEIPLDENGVPENIDPARQTLDAMNTFMRSELDVIFGEGTSQAIFGDAIYRNPEVYVQLIEGIKPFVEPVRAEKLKKYIVPKPPGKPRKRKAKVK